MDMKTLVRNSLRVKIDNQEPTQYMLLDCMDYVSENTPDITEVTAEQINDTITDYVHEALHKCENCGEWIMDDETIVERGLIFCSEKCKDGYIREADAEYEAMIQSQH